MNKKEFKERVNGLDAFMNLNAEPMEKVNSWMGQPLPNAFIYGATSERCMENNMMKGEREYTFMFDLSTQEWVFGKKGVLDYLKQAITEWKDNEHAMAELILSVNFKSWEHAARSNNQWGYLYSELFYYVRDLTYDYYENDQEKVAYVWEYLD